MPGRLTVCIIILAGIICATTYGNVLQVPGAYATIQSAINAAQVGDTVLVAPGTYFVNLNFRGKNIVVSSHYIFNADTSFISQTIINGSQPGNPDTASCVLFINGESATAVLQGFTLTGGMGTRWPDPHSSGTYREGGGILTQNTSPTIRYNRIIYNDAINTDNVTNAGGGGIRSDNGNPHILNNIIEYNRGRYGAGIVLNFCGGTIRNNIIAHNSGGESFGGAGIWISDVGPSQPIVENNTIVENVSALDGGGILVWNTSVTLRNNIIWGNTAPTGPQIRLRTGGSANVTYCDVEDGWSGSGNVNLSPQFTCVGFYLKESSPLIDLGDIALSDPENIVNPGIAAWPTQGTLHSDIGAYGGPGSGILGILGDLLPPQLLVPPNEAVNQPQTMVFRWHPNNCGAPYHVQIANDSGFASNVLIDTATIFDTSFTLSGIPNEAVYYWRIESADTSLGNGWSPVWRFVVGGSVNTVEFDSGWGMISFPFHVDDPRASVIIPPVHTLAYEYNGGGYTTKDTLKNGVGYWMRFQNHESFTFIASTIVEDTIDVVPGWNLIGSIGSPVATSSITSDPSAMITSQFFTYNGTYVHSDSLLPCHGYWVNVDTSGKLILSTGSVVAGLSSRIHMIATDKLPPMGPTIEQPDPNPAAPIPAQFRLLQNYPNPFNPVTTFHYELSTAGFVQVTIYNVVGREVEKLVNEHKEAGSYISMWDGSDEASGVYYVKMRVRDALGASIFEDMRKVVLLK